MARNKRLTEKRYQCPLCKRRFRGTWDVGRHIRSIHKSESQLCPETSAQEDHSIVDTPPAPPPSSRRWSSRKCAGCFKVFARKDCVERHVQLGRCKGQNSDQIRIPLSKSNPTPLPGRCTSCGRKFPSRWELKGHLERVHQRKLFQCGKCPCWTERWEHMVRHGWKKHGMEKKTKNLGFPCRQCKRSYVNEEALWEHTGRGECLARVNGQMLGNAHNKQVKRMTVQKKPTECATMMVQPKKPGVQLDRISYCVSCAVYLDNRAELKVHLEKVHQRRLFSCGRCPFWCTRSDRLAHHIRTAHGMEMEPPKEQEFKCRCCSRAYVSEKALRDHKRSGECGKTGNSLTRCTSCSFELNSRQELRLHLEQVHRQKLFPCRMCAYWSLDWNFLIRHAKKKHGIVMKMPEDRGLFCKPCRKRYVSREALEEHRNSEHGDVPDTTEQPKVMMKKHAPKDSTTLPLVMDAEEMVRRLTLQADTNVRQRQRQFDPTFFLHMNRYKPDS